MSNAGALEPDSVLSVQARRMLANADDASGTLERPDDNTHTKTSARRGEIRRSMFLLRDRIRLFDRFALDEKKLSASYRLENPMPNVVQTARDDNLDDEVRQHVVFPGWQGVPQPPLSPRVRTYVPVGARSRSRKRPQSARSQTRSRDLSPILLNISGGERKADARNLDTQSLVQIEEKLEDLLENALNANTRALTSAFQQKLREQFQSVERRHRLAAQEYKKKVLVAMKAAQSKLDRVARQELEARRKIRELQTLEQSNKNLISDKERLNQQLVAVKERHEQERAEWKGKMMHLRELALASRSMRTRATSPNRLTSSPTSTTAGGKANETRTADETPRDDGVIMVSLSAMEEKNFLIESLQGETQTLHRELAELRNLHNRLKSSSSKKLKEADERCAKLNRKVEAARDSNREAEKRINELEISLEDKSFLLEQVREERSSLTQKLAELQSEHESALSEFEKERERQRLTLRKAYLHSMTRTLVFQAHLDSVQKALAVCDKIDEYLSPSVTCKQCFQLLREAVVLYPCGHSVCDHCLSKLPKGPGGRMLCNDCGEDCENVTVPNVVVDYIVSRYNWWKVTLEHLRKNLHEAESSRTQRFSLSFAKNLSEEVARKKS